LRTIKAGHKAATDKAAFTADELRKLVGMDGQLRWRASDCVIEITGLHGPQ
jgi:hypothetical protein